MDTLSGVAGEKSVFSPFLLKCAIIKKNSFVGDDFDFLLQDQW